MDQYDSPYVYCGNNPVNLVDPTGAVADGPFYWELMHGRYAVGELDGPPAVSGSMGHYLRKQMRAIEQGQNVHVVVGGGYYATAYWEVWSEALNDGVDEALSTYQNRVNSIRDGSAARAIALRKKIQREAKLMKKINQVLYEFSSRKVVSLETGVAQKSVTKSGDYIDVKDAYDLTLYQTENGKYELIVSMEIQFNFTREYLTQKNDWTESEEIKWMNDWINLIQSTWGGREYEINGKKVEINFDFDCSNSIFTFGENWNISVEKLAGSNTYKQSKVDSDNNDVKLDNFDLNMRTDIKQFGASHEFGHMIRNWDEYQHSDPEYHRLRGYEKDTGSIMNHGNNPRKRHYQLFLDWFNDN